MRRPFAYHQQVVAHLKAKAGLWQFFSTDAAEAEDFKRFKTELLKNTYRLEPEAEPDLYAAIDRAKAVLEISQAVTVYQLLQSTDLNASVYVLPTEVHIVLSGGILKLLDNAEMEAVLAHELGHARLYAEAGGDYRTAHRILDALSVAAGTPVEYLETARRYDLYTELYCDAAALKVAGKAGPVVSSLVKVNTGLDRVSAESYLRQSAEIFDAGEVKSETLTHPENFIRAYALHLCQTAPDDYEAKMEAVIRGQYKLRELDILSREALHAFSQTLVTALLSEKKMQTEVLLNLAKQYFPAFAPAKVAAAAPDAALVAGFDPSCREYVAYLLLDFALADKSIEPEAYAHAYALAHTLGLAAELKDLTKKEGKLSEKKYNDRYKKTLAQHA